MAKYKIKITELTVAEENENIVFSETRTHVRVDDEGAGMFLVLKQESKNDTDEAVMQFGLEEWQAVCVAVNRLLEEHPDLSDE